MPPPRTARPTTARRVLVGLAVVGVVRALLPDAWPSDVLYALVAVGAAAVAWWAVAHGARASRWTATGMTLAATGDTIWVVLHWNGLRLGEPSLADPLYLAAFLALGMGVRRVLVQASRSSRFDQVVDTAAVFLVVAYLEWVLVIGHTVTDGGTPITARLLLAAYPLLDAWLLALVVPLWLVHRAARAEAGWVALAAGTWFVSDLGYLAGPTTAHLMDAGWSLGAVALAASALAALGARQRGPEPASAAPGLPVSRAQLALALVPLAVPGAVQVVATAHGEPVDPVPGIVVTGVVLVLVFLRGARMLAQQTELRAALEARAFHDVLTGLPNRALFDDRVTRALARSTRTGVDPVVLSLDLDGFKTVNDTLGHPAGDQLLRQVAARLLARVRPADTVAWLGGDEFAVLLEPHTEDDPAQPLELARRLVDVLGTPYEVEGRAIRVGVSIGLVRAEPDGTSTSASLLRDVDTALYRAKDGGKGQVAVFEPAMRAELLCRTSLDGAPAALPAVAATPPA